MRHESLFLSSDLFCGVPRGPKDKLNFSLELIPSRCYFMIKSLEFEKTLKNKQRNLKIENFAATTLIHYSHQVRNGKRRREFVPWVILQHTFSNIAALNSPKRGGISKCYTMYIHSDIGSYCRQINHVVYHPWDISTNRLLILV